MTKVIIVGGSVGGLSCACLLIKEGFEVLVLEKARKIVPAGAGLGLDPVTCDLLASEFNLSDQLQSLGRPMPAEECRWVDSAVPLHDRQAVSLAINNKHNHRSLHWSDLHRMLFDSLSDLKGCIRMGHRVIAYTQSGSSVTVRVQKLEGDGGQETVEFTADVVIAADGSNSTVRRQMFPTEQRRYTGWIAWRGVLKAEQHPELVRKLKADFANLEEAITYDISPGHGENVIYMLPGGRINWIWVRDAPEPDLEGHSVTMQPTPQQIKALQADAADAWTASFAELVKATEPFLNVIYERDPLERWTDGRVVLLGEAAHPTTSFASRSTNMSIQDCSALAACLREHRQDLPRALKEFEQRRIQQTTHEVLFSKCVGELRHGRLMDGAAFDWPSQPDSMREMLLIARIKDKLYRERLLEELSIAGSKQ